MRVLFTTAPLHGHLSPLVPLAWACQTRGHEILLATSDGFVASGTRAGLPTISVGPGIGMAELADPSAAYGIEDARYVHGRAFGLMAARNLAGTMAVVNAWRPDLVVAERAELAGPVAAGVHGVPLAELRWGAAELGEYRAGTEDVLRAHLHRLGLDRLPKPDLILNPWPPSLRLPHATHEVPVRHVPYDGVSHIAPWMLETPVRPRICVTLGTVLPHLSRHGVTGMLRELLDNLATLDVELVVAVDDETAAQLRPLPPAVRHAGWLPLSRVLPTCALVIHHGGHGSSLSALAAGCPQVALPRFDDAIENADAVVRSGAGLSLRLAQTTPQRIATDSQHVMRQPWFRESAARVAKEIAAQPSPAKIVDVLETLARRVEHVGSVSAVS